MAAVHAALEAQMPTSRYFIEGSEDNWRIRFRNSDFGPYRTCREAMMFAVDAAHQLGSQGEVTEVCIMGDNGRFRSEWAFGRDSYPPRL